MNQTKAQQESASNSVAPKVTKKSLNSSWLLTIRIAWLALVIPSLGFFIFSLPIYYAHIQQPCVDDTTCNIAGAMTTKGLQSLAALGFSPGGYAAFYTTVWLLIASIWTGIALLIFLRKSDEWFALLAALFLILFNFWPTSSVLPILYPALTFPIFFIGLTGQICHWLFLLLFPNGRLVPRWTAILILPTLIQSILFMAPPTWFLSTNNMPNWFNGLLALISYGGIIVSQVHRYRRVSTSIERQQTKWVVFGIISAAIGSFLLGLLFTTVFPAVDQSDSPLSLFQIAYPLLLLLLPVTISIAILRYRLWDIDIIIRRTLVYSFLSAFIVGTYILVVGYLGSIFRTGGNLLISLIATGLVAVLFQPLRNLLQRGVNRFFYGLRDEPYVALSRLGQRLKTTLEPDAVLSTIVETVRETLKLSYTAIEIPEAHASILAAASGDPSARRVQRLPLIYQGEAVGTLLIAPRGRDDSLAPADLRLVDDLTQQIGNAVHSLRLTNDLRALTRDLQHSRERLVSTREEERRRLRRDLHDGLGPMLSAILLKVGLVRSLYLQKPDTTQALLKQLETDIESVIGDVRRVVYNLRPPTLDELGLLGALREYIAGFGNQEALQLNVSVEAPQTLPPLPAAVEVAAYRIVQEAVTNVLRHAHARSCRVRIWIEEGLRIEVSDDGIGISERERAGVGLTSMRERAEELGGLFAISNTTPQGTLISARLPLPTAILEDVPA